MKNTTFLPDGSAIFTDSRFVPFMMTAYPPNNLSDMFDGPVPKVGDAIECLCYEATDTTLCFKWRVVVPR
jgi:hypothetical protein